MPSLVFNMAKNLILLVLTFICLSCDTENDKKYIIAFSQCCDDGWRDVMNREMQRELLFHPEIDFKLKKSGFDSQEQVRQIRELIKEDIDLLIITPNETEPLTEVLVEAYSAGIPTILIDRKVNSESYTSFVGADNYEIGYTAGKYLLSKFPKGANILELTMDMNITPAVDRKRGFADAIKTNKAFQLTTSLEIIDINEIEEKLKVILKESPEINIVFAQTDLLAKTAYNYMVQNRSDKKLFYVGIDGIPVDKGIKDVLDAKLDATFLYPTGGGEAIQLAMKILKGQSFEKENKLVTSVIDKENAEIMYSQIRKINAQQKDIELQASLISNLNKTFTSQRNTLYLTSGLLSLVLIFGAILLYLFKEKQSSNKLLSDQNESINRQKDEIERVSNQARIATEEKFRFYSYVSHEFKTPLTLILTPTEDLLNTNSLDKSKVKGTLLLIQKNAKRLLRLVNQLLEIRQLDAGKMNLEKKVYDMVAFLREITNDFRSTAENKKIDLQFICSIETYPFSFDFDKLDKVFFNLISNAFKYTPDGGYIHLTLRKNKNHLEFLIEDNGIGMSEEEKNHAFDLFYRANSNISLGTGLGLALTHEFVELHDGSISIESQKNKGTTFKILLPQQESVAMEDNHLKDVHHREMEGLVWPTEQLKEQSPYENSLIIIEDNEDMLQFLKTKFQDQYDVYTAKDAEKGWEIILSQIPDIIISDVMLPGKNGFSLTEQVKEDFRTSHIPVILLTAKGQIESQIEGTKAGADAYLSKPFNQQFLEEKVKGLMENRERMKRRFSNEVLASSKSNSGERKFLIEFENLIQNGIQDNTLSVEALSKNLGMSRVQLYRKITALTGINVNDYIADYKIKKAKVALKDTSLNIAEIAYSLGFNSPAYFTTFFKQKTGQTPTEWRA
jgi:signal transduction histidine kinase/DNA-binding response OmpR family regulator